MVLHSWGGCRELLLKGSSFLERNQRSSQALGAQERPGCSRSKQHCCPLPGQELSLPWGECPIFIIPECPGDAPCPPMTEMTHPW